MSKILTPIVVVVLGLASAVSLVNSKTPVATLRPASVDPLVRVPHVSTTSVPLTAAAQGTVLPSTETTLAAQVAAEIVSVSPHFMPGGFFDRGEVLVRLDRRQYQLEVEHAAAKIAQAELRLAQQEAEARVAADEWRELGQGQPDALVLRQPQMAEARAMLKAAEAELGMARLALERTTIRAPFDGRVHKKAVDIGQYLVPGQEIATVHAIDYAEVRLPVPDRQLAFLDLPMTNRNVSQNGPVTNLSASFSGQRHAWAGRIVRTESELDRRSRMMHLVARVEDPYGRHQIDGPPLAMGLFVDAEIVGRTVAGVILPRAALRGDSQVLVVDDEERLRYREVEVVRTLGETVVIGAGLAEGERVCISPLDVAIDGMRVRTMVESPAVEQPGEALQPPSVDEAPSPTVDIAEVDNVVSVDRPPLPERERPTLEPSGGRLLAVDLLTAGESPTFEVSVGGELSYSTSRLTAPHRFVVDLLGVVKSSSHSKVEVAEGPVARVRIGQFQAEPMPIARLVFDLRQDGAPVVERGANGLTVQF